MTVVKPLILPRKHLLPYDARVPTRLRLSKAVEAAFRELGRQGGKTRAKRLTAERRSEIAKKAAKARWAKVAREKKGGPR